MIDSKSTAELASSVSSITYMGERGLLKMLPIIFELQLGVDGDGGFRAFGGGHYGELNVFRGIARDEQSGDVGAFQLAGADGALFRESAAQVSSQVTALGLTGRE